MVTPSLPLRARLTPSADAFETASVGENHTTARMLGTLRVWAISLVVFLGVAVGLAMSDYLSQMPMGLEHGLTAMLWLQLSDNLTYVPLAPLAYTVARRYPLQRDGWAERLLRLLGVGVLFTTSHVFLRGLTPYAMFNSQLDHWQRAVTGNWREGLHVHWSIYGRMLVSNTLLDLIFVYMSIVLIAHAVAYHENLRQEERRKSQLEAQLATARLDALRSQLRPHFLFNTLHSISSLMLTDVAAADRMMSLLSDLLRRSLASDATQLVTLGEEMQFVDTYLAIESIRFEERLAIVRDIPPATLEALVPHLLLQPLVENAVRHGVARLAGAGRIRISATCNERSLHLSVADNGPGLIHAHKKPRVGLGLKSTEQRLHSLYGDDYEMLIGGGDGSGVEVRLRIPLSFSAKPSRGPRSQPSG